MLFALIAGILIMLLGVLFIASENPRAERKTLTDIGIIIIVCGISILVYAIVTVTQGWVLERQNFLGWVSKDSYLIKNEETYVYKENYPNGEGKTRIIEAGNGIEVEIHSINKEEMAYVLVSKKVEMIDEKRKYEFYVPADNIDEN